MLWISIRYKVRLLLYKTLLKIGFSRFLFKDRYGERLLVFHGVDTVGCTKFNSRFVSKDFFENFIQYITKNYNVISLDDFYKKKFKKNTLNIAITFDDGYLNNYKYAVPILKKLNVPASFYITTIHEKETILWPDFIDLVSSFTKKKELLFEDVPYYKNDKNEFVSKKGTLKNKLKTLPYDKIAALYPIFKEEWDDLKSKPLNDYWELMNKQEIKEIANDPLFSIGTHGHTHANL